MDETPLVHIEQRLGYTWIELRDAVTMDTYIAIEHTIVEALRDAGEKVVLDMRNINHLYSSGMGLLIRLRKTVGEHGGFFCCVNVSKKVRNLLQSVQLDRIIPIYATDVELEISRDDIWEQKHETKRLGFVALSRIENRICRINLSGQMTILQDLSSFDESVCTPDADTYVFDITGLDIIDSNGAHLLTKVIMAIGQQNGISVAYGANSTIKELLDLLSLSEQLPCYPSEREAIEAVKR